MQISEGRGEEGEFVLGGDGQTEDLTQVQLSIVLFSLRKPGSDSLVDPPNLFLPNLLQFSPQLPLLLDLFTRISFEPRMHSAFR